MASILIVANDLPSLRPVAAFLRTRGHRLALAATGIEALRLGAGFACDLIVADLQLPDVDGLTLFTRFRDAGVQVPFVVMSEGSSSAMAFEAGRLGVAAYREKPIRPEDVLALVQARDRNRAAAESAAASRDTATVHARLALSAIEEHFHEPAFTIRTAASICGVTREHLSRVLREETGRTFTDLLRTRRLREAERLLIETPLRIKEIYQQVGLASASGLDHAFKRVWQASPTVYRRTRRTARFGSRPPDLHPGDTSLDVTNITQTQAFSLVTRRGRSPE